MIKESPIYDISPPYFRLYIVCRTSKDYLHSLTLTNLFFQAKHIGLMSSFESECERLTERKLVKRKASNADVISGPILKQQKFTVSNWSLSNKMLDEYVMVSYENFVI